MTNRFDEELGPIRAFEHEWRFLSNFAAPFINGRTVEHYYQAAKTTDPNMVNVIMSQPTPGWAKRMGQTVKLRHDWEVVKDDIMLDLLRLKFGQRSGARDMLLSTGDRELIEGNHWHDIYWGECICPIHNGFGINKLGTLLMQVRKELRNEALGRLGPTGTPMAVADGPEAPGPDEA